MGVGECEREKLTSASGQRRFYMSRFFFADFSPVMSHLPKRRLYGEEKG